MAVIITDMDMPKNCNECKNKNCHYFHQIWWDCDSDNDYSTIRNPHCSLKSINEMIDEINSIDLQDIGKHDAYVHNAVYKVVRDIKKIIHKYCD